MNPGIVKDEVQLCGCVWVVEYLDWCKQYWHRKSRCKTHENDND